MDVDLGTGLVASVIFEVKFVMFPTTPAEKLCTPFTIDAAKSEPGRCGNTEPPDEGVAEGMELAAGFGA